MEYNPESFSKVIINSREENVCSPKKPEITWRGILINVPVEIIVKPLEDSVIIPLCGFYHLDLSKMHHAEALKFTVIQTEPKVTFVGLFLDEDPSPQAPNPDDEPVNPEDLKGMSTSTYFNPNLLQYVHFPAIPGDYKVYVEYAGSKSNIALFKIRTK